MVFFPFRHDAGIFRPNKVSRRNFDGMKTPNPRCFGVWGGIGRKAEVQNPNGVSAKCAIYDTSGWTAHAGRLSAFKAQLERRSSRPGPLLDQLWFVPVHVILPSPVVQIGPVGGPPRRSADRTPKPPPAVRTENLQVASSTRAANARNKPVVQVIRTVKRVRFFKFNI